MFRIAFLTEDRKLADVLRLLVGLIHNLEVAPVTFEAPAAAAPVPRKRPGKGGGLRTTITPQAMGLKRGDRFNAAQLVPLIQKLGLSKGSTWYATKRMLGEGTIRRVAEGQYEVQ